MDIPLQPHSRTPSRLVYLCGLPDYLKRDFCRYFRESVEDCDLRIFNLEDGMRTAILHGPTFLFAYAETAVQLARISPDIAFLRCKIPHINRVLVCSHQLGAERLLDEVSLDGILTVDAKRADLIACINSVGRGLRYVQPSFRRTPVGTLHLPDTITDKEQQILKYISLGMQNKQIADLVHSSPHTVKNHKSNMIEKLGLSSTTGLYRFAIHYYGDVAPNAVPLDN